MINNVNGVSGNYSIVNANSEDQGQVEKEISSKTGKPANSASSNSAPTLSPTTMKVAPTIMATNAFPTNNDVEGVSKTYAESMFDTDTEGWTPVTNNSTEECIVEHNKEGYIVSSDNYNNDGTNAINQALIAAPEQFTGDWSNVDSVSAKMTYLGLELGEGSNTLSNKKPMFVIEGQDGTKYAHEFSDELSTEWNTFSVDLKPENWKRVEGEASFEGVTKNVKNFYISGEGSDYLSGAEDKIGIDEIKVTEIDDRGPEKIYWGDVDTENELQDIINGGYTQIFGHLKINGSSRANLDGLEKLTSIKGNLEIINSDALTDIDGLQNLNSVDGNIFINYNNVLNKGDENLLKNLETVGGNLQVGGNNELTSLGLNNLSSVEGNIDIGFTAGYYAYGNNKLTDIGLSELKSVDGNFNIERNNTLENIDSLANLTSLGNTEKGGRLSIINNGKLQNIDGLNGITSLNDLNLLSNNSLKSIDGLTNLNAVKDDLTISNNHKISDANLNGLGNLSSIGGNLSITNQSNLIALDGLKSLSKIGGNLDISNNAKLGSLQGLHNITEIGGDVKLYNNDEMSSIIALNKLSTIGGSLEINNNNKLVDLRGLNFNLNSVGKDVIIKQNYALENIDGLKNISSLNSLNIDNNDKLTTLAGLDNLSGEVNSISISGNAKLKNIESLSGLTKVRDSLYFGYNDVLENLTGLNNITEAGNLNLKYNNKLNNLTGLNKLENVGNLNIESNSGLKSWEGSNFKSLGTLSVINNNVLSDWNALKATLEEVESWKVSGNAINPAKEAILAKPEEM